MVDVVVLTATCIRRPAEPCKRMRFGRIQMPTVDEIAILEERLRVAELGPDPAVFDELLADDVILVAENGQPFFAKQKVVDAHRAGAAPKFTRVEMRDLQIVD